MSNGLFAELFILGAAAAFSTCSTACLPLFLTMIIGRWATFTAVLTAACILALPRLVVFAALGGAAVGIGYTVLSFFGEHQRLLLLAAGAIIFGLGLLFVLAPGGGPSRSICLTGRTPRNWWDLVLLGAVMAAIPCPPHLAVLAFIGVQNLNLTSGVVAAGAFALGKTVPLLLCSALAGTARQRFRHWLQGSWVRRVAGVMMLLMALRLAWPALWP